MKEIIIKYFRLGFQAQVEQSSESARLALQTVSGIEDQIQEVDAKIQEAENVICLISLIMLKILIFLKFR